LDLLFQKGVPEKHRRWYVKRVEEFLKRHPDKNLQSFSASDLEAYFQQRSQDTSLNAWQYRQLVDALQLLFVDLSSTSLSKTMDWSYWREAFVEYKAKRSDLSKEIASKSWLQIIIRLACQRFFLNHSLPTPPLIPHHQLPKPFQMTRPRSQRLRINILHQLRLGSAMHA
jgi:hypothetical protein